MLMAFKHIQWQRAVSLAGGGHLSFPSLFLFENPYSAISRGPQQTPVCYGFLETVSSCTAWPLCGEAKETVFLGLFFKTELIFADFLLYYLLYCASFIYCWGFWIVGLFLMAVTRTKTSGFCSNICLVAPCIKQLGQC